MSFYQTTTVTKIDLKDKTVYAKINWEENENIVFEIKIFDDGDNWSGSFTREFAEDCRKDVEESEDEYYENIKNCLSNITDMYVYELIYNQKDPDTATFKWKKYYEGTTTKLIHGLVDLHRDPVAEHKDTLIDLLLNENLLQRKHIEESQKKNDLLKLEMDKVKDELVKFVHIKNTLEDNLYGKFVSLLNTKKRRIQVLEDHLHKCESN